MKERDFHKPLLSIFLSYFGNHRKLFMVDMMCALAVAGIDVAFPLVSRFAMYELLPGKLYQAFFTVMGIVVLAFILRAVMNFVITFWGHQFGIRVEADIRSDLYKHFQELDYDFFDKNRTGQLMSRLTGDLFEITELAHHGPEDLLISLITIVGAMIFMFRMEWRLALVVLVIVPIFALLVMASRKSMVRSSAAVKQKLAIINADIEGTISGMKTSKAFDNSALDYGRFDRSNREYRGSKVSFYKSMGTFTATLDFFVSILNVAVISVGGWLIMQDRMNYIDLITFTMYITTFVTPVRKLAAFAEVFTNGTAGLRRFVDLMRIAPSVPEKQDAKVLAQVEGDIVLKNVDFGYKAETEVLHGVNLHIHKGEYVAVVGHSGGGKSTLCQLIPRFYDVESGSITIDGMDVRDVTKSSLRRSIGIVQQDVFLFADTICENIRYGRPDATMEEIVEAAKKAEIYDDIMAMPDGFDTYVGERGTRLSGGQKQRVSIARIFLKNPPILILDEATSALDSITEAHIQQALEQLAKGRTTIVIAHRLATIRNADKVVLIEDGKVQEEGSIPALLEQQGAFAKLYNMQMNTSVRIA